MFGIKFKIIMIMISYFPPQSFNLVRSKIKNDMSIFRLVVLINLDLYKLN